MVIESLLRTGAKQMEQAADRPLFEARLLLSHALNCDMTDLIVQSGREVTAEAEARFWVMVNRRAKREPMAYIIGKQPFFGLEFEVTPEVLIPRADTETLVELILAKQPASLLDLCTGSGCVAISAAVSIPAVTVAAMDISKKALKVAARNSEKHKVQKRVAFYQQDILQDFVDFGKFDMVVSNPPYIRTEEMGGLMPDVREFEPAIALEAGKDGLMFYRRIVRLAPGLLNPEGFLAFEVGCGQADAVCALMQPKFSEVGCKKDLAGIRRVVFGKRKK